MWLSCIFHQRGGRFQSHPVRGHSAAKPCLCKSSDQSIHGAPPASQPMNVQAASGKGLQNWLVFLFVCFCLLCFGVFFLFFLVWFGFCVYVCFLVFFLWAFLFVSLFVCFFIYIARSKSTGSHHKTELKKVSKIRTCEIFLSNK